MFFNINTSWLYYNNANVRVVDQESNIEYSLCWLIVLFFYIYINIFCSSSMVGTRFSQRRWRIIMSSSRRAICRCRSWCVTPKASNQGFEYGPSCDSLQISIFVRQLLYSWSRYATPSVLVFRAQCTIVLCNSFSATCWEHIASYESVNYSTMNGKHKANTSFLYAQIMCMFG